MTSNPDRIPHEDVGPASDWFGPDDALDVLGEDEEAASVARGRLILAALERDEAAAGAAANSGAETAR